MSANLAVCLDLGKHLRVSPHDMMVVAHRSRAAARGEEAFRFHSKLC